MSEAYEIGNAIGTWLARHRLWSYTDYQNATLTLREVGHYLWLIAGLLLIWIGLIGMYVIDATGMPSTPAGGVVAGPFCIYRFFKLRLSHS